MAYKRSSTDFHTLPHVAAYRTKLRKSLTPTEAAFWNIVKNSKLDGRKFRRQHSVGNYIIDFYCPAEKLGVELDGEGHFSGRSSETDVERRRHIESHGIKIIRIENKRVFEDPDLVIEFVIRYFGWKDNAS